MIKGMLISASVIWLMIVFHEPWHAVKAKSLRFQREFPNFPKLAAMHNILGVACFATGFIVMVINIFVVLHVIFIFVRDL